jgi:two-component system chemotaxis response regulator CheB
VLSGVLDDGTVGLLAIKRAGGATFAQDPEDAHYPGMPSSAIEYVQPDHVATAEELGRLLAAFARTSPANPMSERGAMHEKLVEEVTRGATEDPQPGESVGLTCPECQGAIWVSSDGATESYRCRVGHVYTEESFAAADAARVETALWTALRALEERSALHRRMATRARERGHRLRADSYERSATGATDDAVVLRDLLATFVGGADEEVA